MPFDSIPVSKTAEIDRAIEEAIGEAVAGPVTRELVEKINDLMAKRLNMGEPDAFARIEALLGGKIAA